MIAKKLLINIWRFSQNGTNYHSRPSDEIHRIFVNVFQIFGLTKRKKIALLIQLSNNENHFFGLQSSKVKKETFKLADKAIYVAKYKGSILRLTRVTPGLFRLLKIILISFNTYSSLYITD